MSLKDELTTEQWQRVVRAPFVAGFAVSAADPSGLIGAFQESSAMAGALRKAEDADLEGSVAYEIMSELKTSEGRQAIRAGIKDVIAGRKPAEASDEALAQLKSTMEIVAEEVPEEFQPLADLISTAAQKVAEAAKEGGFFGFGDEAVSDAETKTLGDIEMVLNETRPKQSPLRANL